MVQLTEEEKNELREIFKQFDTDKSGFLSAQEIKDGVLKILGEKVEDSEVQEMLKVVDTNKDGQISIDEFFKAWENNN